MSGPVVRHYENTREWQEGFLTSLRTLPNVLKACKRVGIGRTTAYEARGTDPEFAAAWDDALQDGIDRIEQVAMQACMDNDYHRDTMRIFMLKSHRREVYGDSSNINLAGQLDHKHGFDLSGLSLGELEALERLIAKATGSEPE